MFSGSPPAVTTNKEDRRRREESVRLLQRYPEDQQANHVGKVVQDAAVDEPRRDEAISFPRVDDAVGVESAETLERLVAEAWL